MHEGVGRCDGKTGKQSSSSKKLVICNPLLYGLVADKVTDAPHVLCVPRSASASKDCASKASDRSFEFINLINNRDGGKSFDEMIANLQGSCGRYLVWDGTSFVDRGEDWEGARTEAGEITNLADLQKTCTTLMQRVVDLRKADPSNAVFQKATEDLGVK